MPLAYLIDEHLRGAFPQSLIVAGLAQWYLLDVLQAHCPMLLCAVY